MRGDIILKCIISFLIPFIIMYSFSYIFYIFDIGFLSVLNFIIYIVMAYILFYVRFNKISIAKTFSIEDMLNFILFLLFIFLCFVFYKLIS